MRTALASAAPDGGSATTVAWYPFDAFTGPMSSLAKNLKASALGAAPNSASAATAARAITARGQSREPPVPARARLLRSDFPISNLLLGLGAIAPTLGPSRAAVIVVATTNFSPRLATRDRFAPPAGGGDRERA